MEAGIVFAFVQHRQNPPEFCPRYRIKEITQRKLYRAVMHWLRCPLMFYSYISLGLMKPIDEAVHTATVHHWCPPYLVLNGSHSALLCVHLQEKEPLRTILLKEVHKVQECKQRWVTRPGVVPLFPGPRLLTRCPMGSLWMHLSFIGTLQTWKCSVFLCAVIF